VYGIEPAQKISQMYRTSWTAKDGLAGEVMALAQTNDGYLWVGSTDGLFRFNGVTFENYQPENGTLESKAIATLYADPQGGLWIGYLRGGASFLRSGAVTNYSAGDGFPLGRVRSIVRDWSGRVWVAAPGGIVNLQGNKWVNHYKQWNAGIAPEQLYVDDRGYLWDEATQMKVMANGGTVFQDTAVEATWADQVTESPDGMVWVWDTERHRLRPLPEEPGSRSPSRLSKSGGLEYALFDRDGSFWWIDRNSDVLKRVASRDALSGLNPDGTGPGVEAFAMSQGSSREEMFSILEDREGNIWVGSARGLDRFRHRNLNWYAVEPGQDFFSPVADANGDMWAGTDPGPVVHLPDGKPVPGSPHQAWGAYCDPNGTIWLYSLHGLWRWSGGRFAKAQLPSTALSDRLGSVTMDTSGTLWAAIAGSGEFLLKDGVWTFRKILDAHPDWTATAAFTDAQGSVWLAYPGVAAKIDRERVTTYSADQGLSIGPIIVIAGDSERVWIGGEDGLAYSDGNSFHKLLGDDGIDFGEVTGIVPTANFGVWIAATPGIVRIPNEEIQRARSQPDYRVKYEVFDLVSDLPESLDRTGEYAKGAVGGKGGLLWFNTVSGVASVDPAHIDRNPLPPPVSIRSMVADGKAYASGAEPKLPALTKNIRIDYDGLSLTIPERVKFRYWLKGWDRSWVDAGVRRTAFFTNLGPGRYTFHVIACNNSGVWNETGAALDFSIAPAWYQTAWFPILCAAAVAGLFWAAYRIRLRQIQRQFALGLEAQVGERMRIARELHDTLLQSFQGAVFQFQAARRLLMRNVDNAMQVVDEAIHAAEEGITEGRAAIRNLRPDSAAQHSLSELLHAAGRELAEAYGRDGNAPIYSVTVEGRQHELSPMLQDELYRIAREVIRNAFTHAAASRIEVEILYDRNQLRLRIRDNGRGIAPEILKAGGQAGHWGIPGIGERARQIGAQLELWSEVGAGTEVQLRVPAAMAYEKHRGNHRLGLFR
jgi:signal transduction histidine kinase/ligand-binding sensor domain-containing protein